MKVFASEHEERIMEELKDAGATGEQIRWLYILLMLSSIRETLIRIEEKL